MKLHSQIKTIKSNQVVHYFTGGDLPVYQRITYLDGQLYLSKNNSAILSRPVWHGDAGNDSIVHTTKLSMRVYYGSRRKLTIKKNQGEANSTYGPNQEARGNTYSVVSALLVG